MVLNDQGGSRMDITQNVTCTLRAEAHHPPVVMDVPPISLENHPTDGRVRISDATTVQTLTSRMGTGGNNVPLVMKAYGISSKESNGMKSDNPMWASTKRTQQRPWTATVVIPDTTRAVLL